MANDGVLGGALRDGVLPSRARNLREEREEEQAEEVIRWARGEINRPAFMEPDTTRPPVVETPVVEAEGTPEQVIARAQRRQVEPGLVQRPVARAEGTPGEVIERAQEVREELEGPDVLPLGTEGRPLNEEAAAEQEGEPLPARVADPEAPAAPEPAPGTEAIARGVAPPPQTEIEWLRRYRAAGEPSGVGPEDIARFRARSLERPMIGVGGEGGEVVPEQPMAGPAEGVPGVSPGYQMPVTAAERFYHAVDPSRRASARARELDAERARLAATATPVDAPAPEDTTEGQRVSQLEVERQQKLGALEAAQDGLVGASIAMAQYRGGAAPRSVRAAYQQALADYNDAQAGYNATFDQERAAIQGVQAARVAAADIDARIAADYAKNIQERQAEKERAISHAMRELDERRQQIDQQIAAVRELRVNPNRVFQRMDTGGKLLFMFAAAADGFARGKGVPTQFWDNVNRVIDRDVQSQLDSFGRQERAIGDEYKAFNLARQNLQDTEARIDMAYAAEFEAAKALAQGMKAKVSGAEQVALLDQTIAQLDRQQKQFQMQAYQAEAQSRLKQIRAAQGTGLRQAKQYMDLAKSLNDIIKQRAEGARGQIDDKTLDRVEKLSKRYEDAGLMEMTVINRELNHLLKRTGGIPNLGARLAAKQLPARLVSDFTANAERFNQLTKNLELIAIQARMRGVMTERDQERFQESLGNYNETTEPRVKLQALNDMWRTLNAKVRVIRAGYPKDVVGLFDDWTGREMGAQPFEVLPAER